MNHHVRSIRVAANTGLIVSVVAVLLSVALHFLSPWAMHPNAYTASWLLAAGCVLAVGGVMLALNRIRRQVPVVRQLESLEEKLRRYAVLVSQVFYVSMVVVLAECVIITLLGENTLYMVVMLLVVLLFLAYPNMYKIKVDLGLTDDEMRHLFGDAYIADPDEEPLPAADAPTQDSDEVDE